MDIWPVVFAAWFWYTSLPVMSVMEMPYSDVDTGATTVKLPLEGFGAMLISVTVIGAPDTDVRH